MKRLIAMVLLLSLLLSGCQPSSKNVDMNTTENIIEESTTLFFEEYEIGILAPYLYVYKEPSYESEIVGAVYQQDICLVIDEAVAESVYWIKLKNPEGWIILNYNYYEEIYSNHEDNYYSEKYEGSTKDGFEPYQIKIQRNSLTVWDVPGYTIGEEWYEITDRRTVTIVEETVIYEYGKERTWGRLETGGWISLTAASYVEEPTTIEKDNNTSTTQTETTTKNSTTQKYETTTQKPTTTQKNETTTSKSDTENKPKVTSTMVHGVKFNYVKSYYFKAEYGGGVMDYDIKLDIEYCKPSDYITGDEKVINIYRPSGLYEKDEIGSVYVAAGTNDFAMFKVTVSGNYIDEFYGYDGIMFRKYNHADRLLYDVANNRTDYIMLTTNSTSGILKGTYYIGFYTSEVARVDFMMLGVGPNGIGEW